MPEVRFEHPVILPNGYTSRPANERSQNHGFSSTLLLEEALDYLAEELQAINASSMKIYTNFTQATNPRLRKAINNDSTIAINFSYLGKECFMMCDSWVLAAHNAYALHLVLRNIQNFEKWGVASVLSMLQPFTKNNISVNTSSTDTSNTDDTFKPWMKKLGLGPTSTLEDANAVYRARAKKLHGDEQKLIALNEAIDKARKDLS